MEDIKKEGFSVEVEIILDHFFSYFFKGNDFVLKIDFVNECMFQSGGFKEFPLFSVVDNEINILVNKITCISWHEVKDIVDIWVLSKNVSFSWRDIFKIANKKSPTDPVEVSQMIKTFPEEELKWVKWAADVNLNEVYNDLQIIAEDILLGKENTLKHGYEK